MNSRFPEDQIRCPDLRSDDCRACITLQATLEHPEVFGNVHLVKCLMPAPSQTDIYCLIVRSRLGETITDSEMQIIAARLRERDQKDAIRDSGQTPEDINQAEAELVRVREEMEKHGVLQNF